MYKTLSHFLHLQNKIDNNSIYFIRLLERLNEFSYEKHLKWYLDFKKPSLNVSYYYLSNRNNITFSTSQRCFVNPISVFVIDAM